MDFFFVKKKKPAKMLHLYKVSHKKAPYNKLKDLCTAFFSFGSYPSFDNRHPSIYIPYLVTGLDSIKLTACGCKWDEIDFNSLTFSY